MVETQSVRPVEHNRRTSYRLISRHWRPIHGSSGRTCDQLRSKRFHRAHALTYLLLLLRTAIDWIRITQLSSILNLFRDVCPRHLLSRATLKPRTNVDNHPNRWAKHVQLQMRQILARDRNAPSGEQAPIIPRPCVHPGTPKVIKTAYDNLAQKPGSPPKTRQSILPNHRLSSLATPRYPRHTGDFEGVNISDQGNR